jgi:hypothetical protein
MCFLWIWEQTAIISLYSIKWLVFLTETECVYCAGRTGFLPFKSNGHCTTRSTLNNSTLCPTMYLCVLCAPQNKQRLFPYAALTDWFFVTETVCPCSENQLDFLFILSLFRQSTCTCFGHICSPLSFPTWPTDSQLKTTARTNYCIYTVYLLIMGYKCARNMYRLIDGTHWGSIMHQVSFHYTDVSRCTVNKT